MLNTAFTTVAALALWFSGIFFQAVAPAAFPRDGAKQLIDNPRVTVWDVSWTKGQVVPMHRYADDTVVVALAATPLKITMADGTSKTADLKVGDMVLWPKGTTQSEEAGADGRTIMTRLKDFKVAPIANKTTYGLAFPRPRVRKLLENDRIIGWDYTWVAGEPTPTHFHDKDVVLTYVAAGALKSTTPDGRVTPNAFTFGETRFNLRDRTHFEEYVSGNGPRAIIMELK